MMQFFWLYMDEMIGKGLEVWMLVQLLVYMSTTLVPLALPLAVLLSSIMTFGNMGENFELVAIKSSGISLLRFMRPLLVFIVFIAFLAFLFANSVIPVANLKALSLLYDVRNSKPALNIRADQFNNDIQGYSIRVGSKDPDGTKIRDIIIYDHTDLAGNNRVVTAKEGEMLPAADKQALIFKLKDGWQYVEGYSQGMHNYTQYRMHFEQWDKVFDLSGLKFTRSNEDMFKNAYQMMNVAQLKENIDSLKKTGDKSATSTASYMAPYVTWSNTSEEDTKLKKLVPAATAGIRKYDSSFMEMIPDSLKANILQTTINNLRNFKSLMDVVALDKRMQSENYIKYNIEFHRKFALSFACILLFLIGAPLGAIIRKGGLGMPLVIAVAFFITFHILNITGEKLAKSGAVDVWVGMWMSTLILLPLAIWLIGAARNDSKIFSKEVYVRVLRPVRNLFNKK